MKLSFGKAISVLFPAFLGARLPETNAIDPEYNFPLVPALFDLEDDDWSKEDLFVLEEVLEGFIAHDLPLVSELPEGTTRLGDANGIALVVEVKEGNPLYYLVPA